MGLYLIFFYCFTMSSSFFSSFSSLISHSMFLCVRFVCLLPFVVVVVLKLIQKQFHNSNKKCLVSWRSGECFVCSLTSSSLLWRWFRYVRLSHSEMNKCKKKTKAKHFLRSFVRILVKLVYHSDLGSIERHKCVLICARREGHPMFGCEYICVCVFLRVNTL